MTKRRTVDQQPVVSAEIAARIRELAPSDCFVLSGSLPVVSFGDPSTAYVASLSLNPSWGEFLDKRRQWAPDGQQRLPALAALRDVPPQDLTDLQVAAVLADCREYFAPDRRPFMGYFGVLDRFLRKTGAGIYFDGSACHLDLVQWATDPVWSDLKKLSPGTCELLIKRDREFLAWQLAHENIRVVLCNGRSVVEAVDTAGIAAMEQVGTLHYGVDGRSTVKVHVGQANGVTFLGWNPVLHQPLAAEARESLAAWVADRVADLEEPPVGSVPLKTVPNPRGVPPSDLDGGFIRLGTTVRSKGALTGLLREWARDSDQGTIGDVGHFGGRPWVRVELGADLVVLNADTKRSAVLDYLAHAADVGHNPPWNVRANRNGRINNVAYRDDALPSPGWYAYLVPPAEAPRTL